MILSAAELIVMFVNCKVNYEGIMNKRLTRSRRDRMIAGVCGGLGNYLGIDPVIIRLLWAVAIFMYGSGLFLYILAWIIIPEE